MWGPIRRRKYSRACPCAALALRGTFASQDVEVVSDSLDITQELLGRYGGLMAVEQHEVLQDALLPLLDEQRGGLRKRAISGLGAPSCPSAMPAWASHLVSLWSCLSDMLAFVRS